MGQAKAFVPLIAAIIACGGDGDTMQPPDAGAIQGSVVDDISTPVTDLTVALRDVGGSTDLATTLTDTLGGFGFTDLDPADYNVILDVPQIYELNGQANPVTARVVAGVTTPVDFTLRLLAGTVTGVVSDTVAAPISGATASLREPGTAIDLRKALSDSSGRYTFSRVPIGDYDLFMNAANGTVLGTNPERISVIEGDTVEVAFTVRIEPNPLGTWQALTPLGSVRTENSVAALDGLIYVVGGFKPSGAGTEAETAVERYNPSTDTWTTVAALPAGVNHAGLAAVGGKLYLVGGYGGATFTGTDVVRIYDPATDSWTTGASLPSARGALAVAVLDGKIHAIGGSTNNGSGLTTHDVYDPAGDTWSSLAAMPTARHHLAAATIDGRIYVAAGRTGGGLSNLTTLEIYNPPDDTWLTGSPVPTARSGVAAAALDGEFYLFGGEGTGGTFDENERYNPTTQLWRTMAPMLTARHGMGAAVEGGTIYVVGGGPAVGLTFSGANERFTPPQ